ncbi:MAG: AhpC/TSA family protein, partial [Oscillospiraceae bacterium]
NYSEIEKVGGKVVVVFQSDAEKLAKQLGGKDALPFDIICDPEQKLYKQFGVFAAASQMELFDAKLMGKMAQVQAMGLEHGDYEGDEMQLPAAFAVNDKLELTYVHYAHGLADIPTPAEIAQLLK